MDYAVKEFLYIVLTVPYLVLCSGLTCKPFMQASYGSKLSTVIYATIGIFYHPLIKERCQVIIDSSLDYLCIKISTDYKPYLWLVNQEGMISYCRDISGF